MNCITYDDMNTILQTWNTLPRIGGWFHILGTLSAVLFIIGGVLLGVKMKTSNRFQSADIVYGIVGVVLIILEILKASVYYIMEGSYPAGMFPFQICTVHIFFCWLIPFIKIRWLKETLIGYVACIGSVAALFYMCKPATALNTPVILLGVQAFLWHDIIIGTGVFAITYHNIEGKKGLTYLLKGFAIWIVFLFSSIAVNELCNIVAPDIGFNFFYTNSNQDKVIYPLLNLLFSGPQPFIAFVISFILYFLVGVFAFYGLATIIFKLCSHIRNKRGELKEKKIYSHV